MPESSHLVYGAVYPSLKGRTVLVTGGGSGIGASIVRHFAAQDANVAFIDVNRDASAKLVADLEREGRRVHFEEAALTDIAAARAAIERIRAALGPITILVNNAAHDDRHKLDEITPEYWDDRFAVNLKHQFFCAQAVYKDMVANGGGAIVNMGSCSYLMGTENLDAYMSAKSGVIGLTRGLARELGHHNIRVNAVLPGWIMTERQQTLWLDEAGERMLMERQCLKRKITPEDLARAVLFFASDEASACTNQSYIVDGGWV
jgi:D-xylose 1-dehydrogenase